ncbi:uncharacterized protein LOC142520657 [Primulina tabacum]|uniref:uncharacterized protein LOC142520657 n=1 Tax=Primulina tabacum TaxID=48773 RepID=UPI003F59C82A
MNCTSYVPSSYQLRDFNKSESGFSLLPFVFDGKNGEEQGNGISLLPYNMDQHLGYDKVLLSQIMQKHEATFKYQVQELHRLYRRQRELMEEIKVREMFARHAQFPTSQSNNCLSQTRSEVSQTSHTTSWILGDRIDNKLSILNTDNLRGPSDFVAENFQGPTTEHPGLLLTRNCYNRVQAPSFINKGHEIRILNLRFPDSVYHGAEERERFNEVIVSKDPKRDSALGPFKTGDSISFDARCRDKKILIDLNEPIQLESVASSSTSPLEPFPCYLEFSHHDPHASGKIETGSVVPKHCRHDNYGRDSVDRNRAVGMDLNFMPLSCSSETVITEVDLLNSNQEYKIEDPKKHLLSFVEKPDNSSGVPCSFESKISQASGVDKTVILNASSVHHLEMSKEKCVKVDPDARIGEKLMEFETHIDLNVGVPANGTFPSLSSNNVGTKSAGETDFEAPVSPENKEGFPPGGKCKDMLLGTPSLLSERGESKPEIENDGIAAETLLLISSAIRQDFNLSNCLYWLAEIATVTGYAEDQENKVMELQNFSTNKDGCMLLSDGIDEFKDATLMLSQKKALNLSRDANKKKERVALSCRSVRGRATKDHHTVKPFHRTCSSKRNVGKNSNEVPKTHSRSYPSNAKKTKASILKVPATRSKVGVLQSWGKIKKRQRGPRRCASKFLTSSEFVLEV